MCRCEHHFQAEIFCIDCGHHIILGICVISSGSIFFCCCQILPPDLQTFKYSPDSHFCCHSSARMPDLVSKVDFGRRAARSSRAWPSPGSGVCARASDSSGRAQPAAHHIMSHGPWNNFWMIAGIHLADDYMHASRIYLWMPGCDDGFWLDGCLQRQTL